MSRTTAPTAPPETAVTRPRALAKVNADTLRQQLIPRLPDLLPPGTTVDRFVALTMQALAKAPELYECDPNSILLSVLEVAQVGLEPTGSIGGAHLVPFKEKDGPKKCQVIYDYRGLQHLIRVGGGGEVKAVLVYQGDHFKVYEGTDPKIEHEPTYDTNDPTKITHVYAWPLDAPGKFEVMTKAQIDNVRASSRLKNGVPWTQHYGQQARKTVIRRIANYLDLKATTRVFIERDTEREFGGEAAEVTVSRASRVRQRLADRKAPQIGPGAPETPGGPDVAPPEETASQQPENATQQSTAVAVCGTPNPEGDALCVRPEGHDGPHGSEDDALIWPREKK
jgi:recombination protein RecT